MIINQISFKKINKSSFFYGSYFSKETINPLLLVQLDEFYMSESLVTQKLYYEYMGVNESLFKDDTYPITNVSYYDANDFCNRFNQSVNNYCIRLPSEAEWEYAARANNNFMFSGSNNLDEVGWFEKNSNFKLHPINQKKPNGFGLYDMSGNVWEWCEDDYSRSFGVLGWPFKNKILNPLIKNISPNKIVRGGCFLYNDKVCKVNIRSRRLASGKCSYVGFRIVAKNK
jgi:formylglycine-generating enzyme required for sulfatase activity